MPEEADEFAELEQELRGLAARFEPVPPEFLDAARGAFAWRDIDAELAELVFDSLADDEAVLVRGSADRRLYSFSGGGLTIDVEVTSSGQHRTVLGQIAPPQAGEVDIRRQQDTVTVIADELGRFQSGPLPPGPLSLRLRPAGGQGPAVITDWVGV